MSIGNKQTSAHPLIDNISGIIIKPSRWEDLDHDSIDRSKNDE